MSSVVVVTRRVDIFSKKLSIFIVIIVFKVQSVIFSSFVMLIIVSCASSA